MVMVMVMVMVIVTVIAMVVMKKEMEMKMMKLLERFLPRLRHLRRESAMFLRRRIKTEEPKVEAYAFD